MRIALRSVLIGDGGDAAAARAIHTGLTNAGVDVVVEGRDTGVPVTAIDAPAPPERNLPVDAHIQWCTPADLDPDVVAPVRVAKLCDAGTATGRDVAAMTAMDEVWVSSAAERSHVVGLGVPAERVVLVHDPVQVPSLVPDAPPGAHGDLLVALTPTADELANIIAAWTEVVPAEADATLLIAGDPGLRRAVVRVVQRVTGRTGELADTMVISERLHDGERLGLMGIAHAVISSDPRHAHECRALGVPHQDLAGDPAALASLFRHRVDTSIPADVRLDADAIAARVLECIGVYRLHGARGLDRGRVRVMVRAEVLGADPRAAALRRLTMELLSQGRVDVAIEPGGAIRTTGRGDALPRALRWAAARPQHPDVLIGTDPCAGSAIDAAHRVAMVQWRFGGAPRAWIDALGDTVDELWVPTDDVRDGFLAAGAPDDRVTVVPLGCELDGTSPPRGRGGDRRSVLRLGWSGTLDWESGLDLVIAAYRTAVAAADPVSLVVAPVDGHTDDAVAAMLDALVADPSAGRVEMRAPAAGPGTAAVADCDVLVSVPRADATGAEIRGALARGIPVIAPDRGTATAFLGFDSPLSVAADTRELALDTVDGLAMAVRPRVHEVRVPALAERISGLMADRAVLGEAIDLGRRAAGERTWANSAAIAARRLQRVALVDTHQRR